MKKTSELAFATAVLLALAMLVLAAKGGMAVLVLAVGFGALLMAVFGAIAAREGC